MTLASMPDEPLDLFATPEPERRPVGALDLTAYRQRLAALAAQGIASCASCTHSCMANALSDAFCSPASPVPRLIGIMRMISPPRGSGSQKAIGTGIGGSAG